MSGWLKGIAEWLVMLVELYERQFSTKTLAMSDRPAIGTPCSELEVQLARTGRMTLATRLISVIRFSDASAGVIVVKRGGCYWYPPHADPVWLERGAIIAGSQQLRLGCGETPCTVLGLCFSRRGVSGELYARLFPSAARISKPASNNATARLASLIASLEKEDTHSPALLASTQCLLDALIWRLAEARSPSLHTPDPLVEGALSLVRRDLTRRWTVAEIAKQLGVSRAVLARRFAAALGVSPEAQVTWLKMRHARERLLSTDLCLAAIAAEVGYSSEFALSRAFRRWHGVAPGTYRKQMRVPPTSTCCLSFAA